VEEILPALRRASVAQGIQVGVGSVATTAGERAGVVSRLGGFARGMAAHLQEVRAEVHKVTWPTWDDLRRTTVIIIIFVIIIGIIIGIMDVISSRILIDFIPRIFR